MAGNNRNTVVTLYEEAELADRKLTEALSGGGGDGTSGGMNELRTRVAVLEQAHGRYSKDMELLLREMQALRSDVADMKGYIRALPTTLQLLGFVVAVFAAAGVTRLFGH